MVSISETTARWLLGVGKRLMREAYNSEWDPVSPTFITREVDVNGDFPDGGFVDDLALPDPSPQRNWMNAIIQFIRVITAIVADQLPADEYTSENALDMHLGDLKDDTKIE